MENLILAVTQGVWIMGKLDIDKNRINDPQRFMSMRKPNSPETILMLEYFPGKPLFWVIKGDYAYYPVKDEEMIAMYVKATTGLIVPEKGKLSLVN